MYKRKPYLWTVTSYWKTWVRKWLLFIIITGEIDFDISTAEEHVNNFNIEDKGVRINDILNIEKSVILWKLGRIIQW